ncbi:hypothetical protein CCP3SC15_910005 [Gammaproteobacteria bacterium]
MDPKKEQKLPKAVITEDSEFAYPEYEDWYERHPEDRTVYTPKVDESKPLEKGKE